MKAFNGRGLKHRFSNIELINCNYSQADQDIFVLTMLDGKQNGTYLEIGCAWPFENNNTALLETKFGWQGLSIDCSPMFTDMWINLRKNPMVCANGCDVDYAQLLAKHNINTTNLDYLSVDCDPAEQTFRVLKTIPFDQLKFAVITFEHDCYETGPEVKLASRNYLAQYGYELVGSSISDCGLSRDFEDWYVHPDLVDKNLVKLYKDTRDYIKDYNWYLYEVIPESLKKTTFLESILPKHPI